MAWILPRKTWEPIVRRQAQADREEETKRYGRPPDPLSRDEWDGVTGHVARTRFGWYCRSWTVKENVAPNERVELLRVYREVYFVQPKITKRQRAAALQLKAALKEARASGLIKHLELWSHKVAVAEFRETVDRMASPNYGRIPTRAPRPRNASE